MSLINILFANLIFNYYFINLTLNRDPNIGLEALTNIQNDFERIGFPVSFSLNSWFLTIFISFFATFLLYFSVYKKIDLSNPVNILKAFLNCFAIYSGTLFFFLYFFRTYNLSRGILLISTFLYAFLFTILLLLLSQGFYSKLNRTNVFKYLPLLIGTVLIALLVNFLLNRDSDNISVDSIISENEFETSLLATVDGDCHDWIGSQNYTACLPGAKLNVLENYGDSLNNVINFNGNLYILDAFGTVFINTKSQVFIDITDRTMNRIEGYGTETGLIGLAFHPNENYFLISFSDIENNLIVERYEIAQNGLPKIETKQVLVKIPCTSEYHLGGNLIWSNYFNDFLLSVGDMEMNAVPLLNSEPFDTTSPRGKILFMNKQISNPKLLSATNLYTQRKDILAYGLRNPWKTYEYKEYLFIPDIGNHTQEELNFVNLSDYKKNNYEPFLFGWPYYEGSINNEVQFNEILLWEDKESSSNISEFIYENSIMPAVYYDHQGPTYYRAALIGGGVIEDLNSQYFEHYIFGDYLSKELFAYDFKKNELYIIPLEGFDSYITSIIINPNKNESVLVASGNGDLVEVSLPGK